MNVKGRICELQEVSYNDDDDDGILQSLPRIGHLRILHHLEPKGGVLS